MGIKLNVEMALLPGEIFKARGKTFTVNVAPAVAWSSLPRDARQGALLIRESVYKMKTTTMNQKIIEPVAQELIEAELTPSASLRDTNKGATRYMWWMPTTRPT